MNKQAVKKHFIDYLEVYGGVAIGMGIGIGIGATFVGIKTPTVIPAVAVTGKRLGIANSVLGGTVNIIEAGRQGPPSWVVQCIETGEVFLSQSAAALAAGVSRSHMSNHLNGLLDHVNNQHFARICLAA
jgi:hypothetical protein